MNIVENILSQHFPQSFDKEIDLFEQGMSSLALLQLVELASEGLSTEDILENMLENPTVNNLVQLVEGIEAPKSTQCQTGKIENSAWDIWISKNQFLMELDQTVDLFEQEVTSLIMLRIVEEFESEFNVKVDLDAFILKPTLQYLKESIQEKGKSKLNEVGIMGSKSDKEVFLAEHRQIRKFDSSFSTINIGNLESTEFNEHYQKRRSATTFGQNKLNNFQLFEWLKATLASLSNDSSRPRYLYPSAGGTYSVQLYLEVKRNTVDGLNEGLYYLNPYDATLTLITHQSLPHTTHFFYNREYHDTSSVCLYFISDRRAIDPIYKDRGNQFIAIEAGCIAQLLTMTQFEHGISSRLISGVSESVLSEKLQLDDEHEVILSMVCGPLPL